MHDRRYSPGFLLSFTYQINTVTGTSESPLTAAPGRLSLEMLRARRLQLPALVHSAPHRFQEYRYWDLTSGPGMLKLIPTKNTGKGGWGEVKEGEGG